MSKFIEKLINVRNNGSKRQAHIDLANKCIQVVVSLERQLAEFREFEKEIGRKLIINKIGALSDKELILSLRDYFGEQLKEKGDE